MVVSKANEPEAAFPAVLFQLKGPGFHEDIHTFEKPWFTTWESALSCWVSLIIFWIIKLAAKLASKPAEPPPDHQQPLLAENDPEVRDLGFQGQ